MDKIKLNIKGIEEGLKKTTEAMNAILETKPYGLDIEAIVKDIRERQDNVMAMEFTKCIGELLRKNGVIPKITEYTRENVKENSIEKLYGVTIDELDFSEHDKPFKKRIELLQEENRKLYNQLMENENDYQEELEKMNRLVSDLYNKSQKEPRKDFEPSSEWYENRHQSDCIEINRLNTTIDVLIHKVEYLRQFAGLE